MAVHGTLAVVVAFALTSLSTLVVGLRFYSRYFYVGKLSSSDWMMLIAVITTWSSAVVNYYQVHFLDYTHAFDSKQAFADVVTGSLLTFWIYRLNYLINLLLIKVSILLFYQYVAASNKTFHRIVRALLIIVVTSSIAMILAGILSCIPVSDAWSFQVFWNGFQGIFAQCYNPTILWFTSAGFHLLTDCIIWILPIPFVLNLRSMPPKRRLELAGIFSIGIMAVIASAVRLYVLVEWSSSWIKQGQNTGNLLIWSQVEQHAGIISASIPFLRPLVRKLFGVGQRREHLHPPSPAAKLIPPQITPENAAPARTPIIPSPSPTLGGSSSFRVPPEPLSPVSPIKPEIMIGSTF